MKMGKGSSRCCRVACMQNILIVNKLVIVGFPYYESDPKISVGILRDLTPTYAGSTEAPYAGWSTTWESSLRMQGALYKATIKFLL